MPTNHTRPLPSFLFHYNRREFLRSHVRNENNLRGLDEEIDAFDIYETGRQCLNQLRNEHGILDHRSVDDVSNDVDDEVLRRRAGLEKRGQR